MPESDFLKLRKFGRENVKKFKCFLEENGLNFEMQISARAKNHIRKNAREYKYEFPWEVKVLK
ncbi:MAG: hypothetical protein A3G52_04160 [Candidatus Taylorbacteria bacterium RIFCSPLOWO2_12_FULL_43_20]|uniref:Uncharacterized protein n=1 Tax=Candidatus Taylorbacteria bacterium RIFCSPLOWO2_12_FULL_43_20 TaxID=1802332 RepID=A0A1G2P2R9_9BACT|nr:MAG: hypothetical protein A2825_00360 [Candidatus Taylorbacteria bacterium RIFCSPHIGHO2_01_FULL_43_120]OHA22582.1 MAG: hypothetical protein A3B98_02720 [Candidatus Taylorbacteria bacterium RIFCSPHIGHO2_02_FULL_43_55]OHA28616.1 MAG: hypothetical protein A3E92_01595 [Candidatus Taylorbacteria bacterium RIFCSPHIGHO2_12_FULL_42_34]OHA30530.1 MAG: hypothetical protein A3B09_00235 [Candidatus Taylorbacteria bacterium RIFCSPLOWO2_01_FULL_43_83]OHA38117.1 MAG: hypothetical protein A3H58_01050 [Candi